MRYIKYILIYFKCEFSLNHPLTLLVVYREMQGRKFQKDNCQCYRLSLKTFKIYAEKAKWCFDVFPQFLICLLCIAYHIYSILCFINFLCDPNCSSISWLCLCNLETLCSSCWHISAITLLMCSELFHFRLCSLIAVMIFVISVKWSMKQTRCY